MEAAEGRPKSALLLNWPSVGFGADETSRMRCLQGTGSGVECEIHVRDILDGPCWARFGDYSEQNRTSLLAQTVKRLSTMRETRVQSLSWEDPLEKEMAIHSSTISWKIPWTEEPGRLQSMGLQRVGHD